MAHSAMTTSNLPALASAVASSTYIERLTPYLVHASLGQRRSLGANQGKTLRMTKMAALTASTTALTESVQPASKALSRTNVDLTMSSYGAWCGYSDDVALTDLPSTLAEYANVLGEYIGESLDEVARDVLVAGTTIQFLSLIHI